MPAVALAFAACDAPPTPPPAPPPPVVEGGEFTPVPAAVDLKLPYDAAPSADGTVIFYTALGSDDETHSLWRVSFDGGDAVELATGFAAPLGIAVGDEDVYVADAGAERENEDDIGALLRVPQAGGEPTRVAAADGFSLRALDVALEDGVEVVYFTGKDPADGAPALARLEGDDVTIVAKGEPLSDPSGVAVSGEVAYVVDTSASADGRAAVVRIEGGDVTTLASGLRAGTPAGISFNGDRSALFVSSLDEDNNAQVAVVNVSSGELAFVKAGLEGNDEAGGVHRARDVDAYAWAGANTVYAITFE